jgi:hypothetical protein
MYNATQAVPITSRYYLQEYITLYRNVIQIDYDQKLVSSDLEVTRNLYCAPGAL